MIALLHSGAVRSGWVPEPGIAAPLLVWGALYGAGVRRLWSRRMGSGVRPWQVACFVAGWLTLVAALLSPLHGASEQLFSMHMVQHELLMTVAAPLIVLGQPLLPSLWAVPRRARAAVSAVVRRDAVQHVWRALTRPVDAWLLHGAVIWLWHIPSLFQATLTSDAAHAAQHISFFGSAVLFWWAIVHPARRAELGMSMVYLFTTAVHTGALGALMSFARSPWYPEYSSRTAAWGLTPMADQQLAGLVMWIPASLSYLIAALLIMRRWMRDSEWTVAQREHATVAA